MSLVLRIKPNPEAEPIEISGIVKITVDSGSSFKLVGELSSNKLTFSDDKLSYLDWYTNQVNSKRLAMIEGGASENSSESSESEEGQQSFQYSFSRGISAYTYEDNDVPYLKSIQSSTPDEKGNVQILPGKTVNVVGSASNDEIFISKLNTGIVNDPGTVYREINVFLWYLYHALNTQVYRLHKFSPAKTGYPAFRNSHFFGTIPSYQALVARWNYLAWKRSFLSKVSESGETLNFSLGYSGVACSNTFVSLKAILTLRDNQPEDIYESTIKFFTLYEQGTNASMEEASLPNVSIKKYNSGGDSTIVSGHGTDDWAGSRTWRKIEIEVPKLGLIQGEHYNASFSLAVALNERTTYFYQSIGDDSFVFDLAIVWTVYSEDGSSVVSQYTEPHTDLRVKTILLHEEEDADAGSISYDGGR